MPAKAMKPTGGSTKLAKTKPADIKSAVLIAAVALVVGAILAWLLRGYF
jgi:hypothetical protein